MKKLFIYIIMLSVGIVIPISARSQQLIVGTISEAQHRNPIPKASIALLRQQDSLELRKTEADSLGHFTIANDLRPTFLKIESKGHEPSLIPVPSTLNGGPTGLGKVDMGHILLAPTPSSDSQEKQQSKRCFIYRLFCKKQQTK